MIIKILSKKEFWTYIISLFLSVSVVVVLNYFATTKAYFFQNYKTLENSWVLKNLLENYNFLNEDSQNIKIYKNLSTKDVSVNFESLSFDYILNWKKIVKVQNIDSSILENIPNALKSDSWYAFCVYWKTAYLMLQKHKALLILKSDSPNCLISK